VKLGSIEQQHLQELYDAAGVARDEPPYTAALARVCRDFQDRTFKNATEAQVYAALLKYVRSGRVAKAPRSATDATAPQRLEQAKLLRALRLSMPRLEPYTREFDSARAAFARDSGADLSPVEFWSVVRLAREGPASRASARAAAGS
jgi:hypothetical protein